MPKRYVTILITYILAQLSGFPVAQYLGRLDLSDQQFFTYVIGWQIFSFIAALIIMLFLLKPEKELPRHPESASKLMIVVWSILGVFMAIFGQALANLFQIYVLGIDQQSENTMYIMEIIRSAPLFIVSVAVIGPILEEIIFRKIIFGEIYKRSNFLLAGLISGIIFAVIHMDFTHLLVYLVMSFVFAFIYAQSKRIIVPIIAHVAMNTIVVIGQLSFDPAEVEKMLEQMQMILIGG